MFCTQMSEVCENAHMFFMPGYVINVNIPFYTELAGSTSGGVEKNVFL